jgi:hypothetical protein
MGTPLASRAIRAHQPTAQTADHPGSQASGSLSGVPVVPPTCPGPTIHRFPRGSPSSAEGNPKAEDRRRRLTSTSPQNRLIGGGRALVVKREDELEDGGVVLTAVAELPLHESGQLARYVEAESHRLVWVHVPGTVLVGLEE